MNPYLGLRYFDDDTADRFFGRDEYVSELLEKIAATRFLAVLGHSGSGKSSLVRAGLIPALQLQGGGGDWRVAKFRPETTPIKQLGLALDEALGTQGSEARLRAGPLGIADVLGREADPRRLILLADQFEELFRLEEESAGQPGAHEEAAAFVRLLLHANRHPRVYTVLTMRSDYLKDCARYRDLPEQINRGIYLVPRIKRDELEQAITAPARAEGVTLDPPLVQRLLNDAAGPDLDHLPRLEHLLSRIWEKGAARGTLTLQDYDDAGGWIMCLSEHADHLYGKLEPPARHVCEMVFRRLTLRDEANRDVRSRATLAELIRWCGGAGQDAGVRTVVNLFRAPDAGLLTPVGQGELPADAVLDITHESLIRSWVKLMGEGDDQGWIRRETEARDLLKDLERRSKKDGQLSGAELPEAKKLVDGPLTEAWVSRYFPGRAAGEVRSRVAKFVTGSRWNNRRGQLILGGLVLAVIASLSVLAYPAIDKGGRKIWRSYQGEGNPKDGLRYIRIPPGEFQMGCSPGDTQCDEDEKPRQVRIDKGFLIGQTEVTQEAYARVMKGEKNPSRFQGQDRPVDSVTWAEADRYCQAVGMRLPTEEEWEYAARAGSKEARYGKLDDIAWYGENTGIGSQPAGTKLANDWGLYDTLGSLWEWTSSSVGDSKVLRGGSWLNYPGNVRVSNRDGRIEPTLRFNDIGFRCAGELP